MKAWHFVGDTLRDGRPVQPDGITLRHDGQLALCESGLHANAHPFDALRALAAALVNAQPQSDHELASLAKDAFEDWL